MDMTLLVAFLTTTLFFVAIPGPSVAFATAQALRYGKRGAVVTVAGDALGTTVHITIATSSLTALITLADFILPPLQTAGGIFLLFMAYRSFTAARSVNTERALPPDRASFWGGFFACVSNPKAIVFFVALFPAFISTDHSILVQSTIYGAIFLVLDVISILAYALLTLNAVKKTTSRWLHPNIISGFGLAGVGVTMIVKGYRSMPTN